MRAISAMIITPVARAGSASRCKYEIMSSEGATYPAAGNSGILTAKKKISMKPSQKTGMENPSVANTITTRSIHELAFQAASTPIGIATASANISVNTASERVGTTRWTMSSETSCLDRIDCPRSPLSMSLNQMPSCTGSGLSNPSWRLIPSTSSWVASCPAMMAAGSPGANRIRANTTSATTNNTGKVARTRLIM